VADVDIAYFKSKGLRQEPACLSDPLSERLAVDCAVRLQTRHGPPFREQAIGVRSNRALILAGVGILVQVTFAFGLARRSRSINASDDVNEEGRVLREVRAKRRRSYAIAKGRKIRPFQLGNSLAGK
jgi:hypothetical protein